MSLIFSISLFHQVQCIFKLLCCKILFFHSPNYLLLLSNNNNSKTPPRRLGIFRKITVLKCKCTLKLSDTTVFEKCQVGSGAGGLIKILRSSDNIYLWKIWWYAYVLPILNSIQKSALLHCNVSFFVVKSYPRPKNQIHNQEK